MFGCVIPMTTSLVTKLRSFTLYYNGYSVILCSKRNVKIRYLRITTSTMYLLTLGPQMVPVITASTTHMASTLSVCRVLTLQSSQDELSKHIVMTMSPPTLPSCWPGPGPPSWCPHPSGTSSHPCSASWTASSSSSATWRASSHPEISSYDIGTFFLSISNPQPLIRLYL